MVPLHHNVIKVINYVTNYMYYYYSLGLYLNQVTSHNVQFSCTTLYKHISLHRLARNLPWAGMYDSTTRWQQLLYCFLIPFFAELFQQSASVLTMDGPGYHLAKAMNASSMCERVSIWLASSQYILFQ